MWWNTVDVTRIPRAPRPRWVSRTPEWHSTTTWVPIHAAGPPITPLSTVVRPKHPVRIAPEGDRRHVAPWLRGQGKKPVPGLACTIPNEAGSNLRASSLPTPPSEKLRRPKSAPSCFGTAAGSAGSKVRAGSAGKRPAVARRRPQSAPTIRSFEAQKTTTKSTMDPFLQMLEASKIKNTVDGLKREKHVCKDRVDGVDVLADTSLYDLRIMHNATQRAKTSASRPTLHCAGSPAKSMRGSSEVPSLKQGFDSSATERLRDLCKDLVHDLFKNGAHLTDVQMETQALEALQEYLAPFEDEESKKKREKLELLNRFGGMFKKAMGTTTATQPGETAADQGLSPRGARLEALTSAEPAQEADTTLEQPPEGTLEQAPSTPTRGKSPAQRAATLRLGELVGFLIGCCGSVRGAFDRLDINKDQLLTMQEWEEGVRRLGFKDDVSYVFKLLGKGDHGEATLDEVQALFDPFLKRTK